MNSGYSDLPECKHQKGDQCFYHAKHYAPEGRGFRKVIRCTKNDNKKLDKCEWKTGYADGAIKR